MHHKLCCTLKTTPSTTDCYLSRADELLDLEDFVDLPEGTIFSSIDARSPGLILVIGGWVKVWDDLAPKRMRGKNGDRVVCSGALQFD